MNTTNSKILHFFLTLSNGTNIHYTKIGKGETNIVMIHGWGMTWKTWEKFMLQIVGHNKFTLIAIDLIGFGDSDKPPINYSIRDLSSTLFDFIEGLKLNSYILMGHSMGVTVCMDAIFNLGLNPESVIFVDSGVRSAHSTSEIISKLHHSEVLSEVIREILRTFFLKIGENDLKAFAEETAKTPISILIKTLKSISMFDFSAQLPELKVPALIFYGKYDKNRRLEEANLLKSLIKDSFLAVIDSSAHCPMFEQTEKFTEYLLRWVEGSFRS